VKTGLISVGIVSDSLKCFPFSHSGQPETSIFVQLLIAEYCNIIAANFDREDASHYSLRYWRIDKVSSILSGSKPVRFDQPRHQHT
jgi:hypothetical protein